MAEDTEALDRYVCAIHFPFRSTRIYPGIRYEDWPLVQARVVFNGELEKEMVFSDSEDGKSHTALHLEIDCDYPEFGRYWLDGEDEVWLDLAHEWRFKVDVPLCDAAEAWELVLAREPISPPTVLDGFVAVGDNLFANADSLAGRERRFKRS